MDPQSGPVLVLGAGATKACNGPLTNEILFETYQGVQNLERKEYVDLVDSCLKDIFRLPEGGARTKASYPGLPLLMSLIDAAIDRGQPLLHYDVPKLRNLRAAIEYVIFAVLEYKLRSGIPEFHRHAFDRLFPRPVEPRIISLNYDIIADNALAALSVDKFPDYCCDIQTETYRGYSKFGKLLKLHGSLNWMYCPNCQRLDVSVSRSGHSFSKALSALFMSEGRERNDLDHRYSSGGSPCPNCKTVMRPVMITPTQKKDYRNPHIAQVWYKAEQMLRLATSVVFVGYSMPGDDVEVVYLLKRGLENLPAKQITVVEYDEKNRSVEEHEVGQRYQSMFGQGLNWHTCGFEGWLTESAAKGSSCRGALKTSSSKSYSRPKSAPRKRGLARRQVRKP
jgi:hypothetical protein